MSEGRNTLFESESDSIPFAHKTPANRNSHKIYLVCLKILQTIISFLLE